MKRQINIGLKWISLIMSMCLLGWPTLAQEVEKEKRISKSYKVTDSRLTLSIQNKFGRVQVATWDKPQIDVEVIIKVDRRNEARADRMLEQINVAIAESSQSISFSTKIDGSLNNKNDESFEINYEIKMPSNLPLNIKNSFGDTYIAPYDGPVELDIAYGNIKAETFSNDLSLELSFGNGQIRGAKRSTLVVKYSKLEIGSVTNATINQQFSDLIIEEMEDINLDAKYGNLRFGTLNNLSGKVSFSGFKLDKLNKSIDLTTSYSGDFTIREVAKDFQRINLEGKFGSFDIGLQSGTQASIESILKFCDMSYSGVPFEFNYVVKDHNSKEYRGKLGAGTGGNITIRSDYGDVRLRTIQN